jgi:hypothetical protein
MNELKNTAFGLDGSVGGLIEEPTHLPVTPVHWQSVAGSQ